MDGWKRINLDKIPNFVLTHWTFRERIEAVILSIVIIVEALIVILTLTYIRSNLSYKLAIYIGKRRGWG